MTLPEFTLLAISSLFVIVNPIAAVPAFVTMTPDDSKESRVRMARLSCFAAAGVTVLFVFAGPIFFDLLGITLPAFQISGSLILMLMAIDMIHARRSRVNETQSETDAGAEKDDIAITPLAVPMLAGPGVISTTMILLNQAVTPIHTGVLVACIIIVFFASYLLLRLAVDGVAYISPLAMKIATRLMGVLLAAIAVQFGINGLKELGIVT